MSYPGMDPSLIDFVEEMSAKPGEMPYEGEPIRFREKMAKKSAQLIHKRPTNLIVQDTVFQTAYGAVKARIYKPQAIDEQGPALLYMHGGGWIIGDLNSHDSVCVDISLGAETIVISLDYALAPEAKFPIALQQCSWVFSHLYENANQFGIDQDLLSIGGDSAGGNLALASTLALRNEGKCLPHYQFLIYPCVSPYFDSPSYVKHENAPFLDKKSMIWIWETYLGNSLDWSNTLAFPMLEKDFSSLPQTVILNAELDPLAYEGAQLAMKLIASKVPTYHYEAKSMIHGFIRCRDQTKLGDRAFNKMCMHLRCLNFKA